MGNVQNFQQETWQPEGGFLPLPTESGLGVSLDESKIGSVKVLHWEG
jgi:hypothetical protein